MVYRNIEESLNLVSMKVTGHDSVYTCCTKEVCHEVSSDRNSRFVLSVLSCPSEVRHNCDYFVCRSSLGCIDGEQKFHQVLCRRECGLENKYGSAPDTLYECRLELSVTERSDFRVSEVNFLFTRLADG